MRGHRLLAAALASAACGVWGTIGAPVASASKCTVTATPTFANVTYGTLPDGTKLVVDIFEPAGGATSPGLVVIDGGSWKSGCKEDVGPDGRRAAQQGFVAFAPNFRQACDKRSKLCGYHAPAPDDDLCTLLGWIRSNASTYHVDPNGIGALGFSSGGQLAYVLGEKGCVGTARPKAVAGFSGDADLPYICNVAGTTNAVCEDRANYIGCTLAACPSAWAANNPTALASSSAAPTFIASGTNDKRTRIEEAQHLHDALANAGATVTLCSVKSGQHSQDLEALPCQGGSQSSWDAMIAFMRAHL